MTATTLQKSGSDEKKRGHVPTVGFVSLGCPKALVDSEQILTQLGMAKGLKK